VKEGEASPGSVEAGGQQPMGIQVSRNLEVQAIVTTFHRRKKPQISAYALVTLEVHHSKKAPSVPLVHPGPNPRGSVRRFTVYIDDESLWLREERRRRRSYALHQHVQLGLNEQEQRARAVLCSLSSLAMQDCNPNPNPLHVLEVPASARRDPADAGPE